MDCALIDEGNLHQSNRARSACTVHFLKCGKRNWRTETSRRTTACKAYPSACLCYMIVPGEWWSGSTARVLAHWGNPLTLRKPFMRRAMTWTNRGRQVEDGDHEHLELPKIFQSMELEDPTSPSSSGEARRWSVEEEERFLLLTAQARSRKRQRDQVLPKPSPWIRIIAWLRRRLTSP